MQKVNLASHNWQLCSTFSDEAQLVACIVDTHRSTCKFTRENFRAFYQTVWQNPRFVDCPAHLVSFVWTVKVVMIFCFMSPTCITTFVAKLTRFWISKPRILHHFVVPVIVYLVADVNLYEGAYTITCTFCWDIAIRLPPKPRFTVRSFPDKIIIFKKRYLFSADITQSWRLNLLSLSGEFHKRFAVWNFKTTPNTTFTRRFYTTDTGSPWRPYHTLMLRCRRVPSTRCPRPRTAYNSGRSSPSASRPPSATSSASLSQSQGSRCSGPRTRSHCWRWVGYSENTRWWSSVVIVAVNLESCFCAGAMLVS